jgi:ECF sigma factor
LCPQSSAEISKLLLNWGLGDAEARDALIPLVYNELRRVAHLLIGELHRHLRRGRQLVSELELPCGWQWFFRGFRDPTLFVRAVEDAC